jgi:hypothetical protein
MPGVTTLIDQYEEHIREVAGWKLQIAAYRLGDKYVCVVSNVDPGATICRVCAPTREEALRRGLEDAGSRLAQMEISDAGPHKQEPKVLTTLKFKGSAYTVGEFIALPLQSRMEFILSGELVYLDGNGAVLQAPDAMKQLHHACQPLAA